MKSEATTKTSKLPIVQISQEQKIKAFTRALAKFISVRSSKARPRGCIPPFYHSGLVATFETNGKPQQELRITLKRQNSSAITQEELELFKEQLRQIIPEARFYL